jgi:hypothetical protein
VTASITISFSKTGFLTFLGRLERLRLDPERTAQVVEPGRSKMPPENGSVLVDALDGPGRASRRTPDPFSI